MFKPYLISYQHIFEIISTPLYIFDIASTLIQGLVKMECNMVNEFNIRANILQKYTFRRLIQSKILEHRPP
jgi:hypothetical protein